MIAINSADQILGRKNPAFFTLKKAYSTDKEDIFYVDSMTKVMLEFSENGPDNTIDVEPFEKYVVPRLVNYIVTYDAEGNMNKEPTYYPLERCRKELFTRDFESKYYEANSDRF